MDPGNRHCMECRLRLADLFCTCTHPETFLCEVCFLNHSKKISRKGHTSWPIAALLNYKDPRYLNRQKGFTIVKEQARQKVTEVGKAISEYRALVEKVIQDILTSTDAEIERLVSVKTQLSMDVETALDEVEKSLSEPQPQLHSKYGPVFRALVGKPAPFQLFVFTPPTCSVSVQTLFSLKYTLCLPGKVLAEPKPVPLRPSQPPQIEFDSKTETPAVAEAHYLKSIEVCAAHFPHSKQFAQCRFNLGKLYMETERFEQAEMQLLQSSQLLQASFSQSKESAECSESLGDLYRKMQRWQQSEEHYLHAIAVYNAHFPQSTELAYCRMRLGSLYANYMHRFEEGETQYLTAVSIYAAHFPQDCCFAICLYWLGQLYMEMKRYEESEESFLRAVVIFDAYFPRDLNYAICLCALGEVYETTGRKEEAVERLQTALGIYDYNHDQEGVSHCRDAIHLVN